MVVVVEKVSVCSGQRPRLAHPRPIYPTTWEAVTVKMLVTLALTVVVDVLGVSVLEGVDV